MNLQSTLCILPLGIASLALSVSAAADFPPDWITRLPVGRALSDGYQDMTIDSDGVMYVIGNSTASMYSDTFIAAVAPDGATLWSRTFNGPGNWHDQARGIALGPGGVVYVTGNTPGENFFANVLLLKYDAASGALLNTVQYSSGPGISEHGASVVTDAQGSVYIGGGTVGDGADGLLLKFDSNGVFQWKQVWDGAAQAPYSQDQFLKLMMASNGDILALIHGVTGSNQPDYVVGRFDPADGTAIWETSWGSNGGDYPTDMVMDSAGDLYITGSSIGRYATIKLRGDTGSLVWEAIDSLGFFNSARGLAVDNQGGVYVTGSVDPDTDRSNSNDNFWSIKYHSDSGSRLWTHAYGLNGVNRLDFPADIIADSAGVVFIAGFTVSEPYTGDMILFLLDASTGVETNREIVPGNLAEEVVYTAMLALDPADKLVIGGDFYNANTGMRDIFVAKFGGAGSQPIEAPLTSAAVQWGTRISGNRRSLENDDTSYLRVRSEVAPNGVKWVQVQVTAISPELTPSRLDLSTIARVNMPGVTGRIWLKNFDTNRWVLLGAYSQPTTFTLKSFPDIANPGAYVRDSDGAMQVRIRYSNVTDQFDAFMDLVQLDITP